MSTYISSLSSTLQTKQGSASYVHLSTLTWKGWKGCMWKCATKSEP